MTPTKMSGSPLFGLSAHHIYLPRRARRRGCVPKSDELGEGQVAINLSDHRLWIGVASDVDPRKTVAMEVKSLRELIAHWALVIERNERRS